MVTEVSALQPSKALPPIFLTLFGMVTEVRDLQSSKALTPISVTLFGMVTEVSALQSYISEMVNGCERKSTIVAFLHSVTVSAYRGGYCRLS